MATDTDITLMTEVAHDLSNIRSQQSTGQLVISQPKQTSFHWQLYFYLGRLVYATGKKHRARRWYRAIRQHCPYLLKDKSFAVTNSEDTSWEAQILSHWLSQNKISTAQARAIIQFSVKEVFFAFIDQPELVTQWIPGKQLTQHMAFLSIEQIIQEVHQLREQWGSVGLEHLPQLLGQFSPDLAPILKQPEELEKQVPADTYQSLKLLLNGQNTLWDVSTRMQRPLAAVTRSLLPLMHQGVIELQSVPDLVPPTAKSTSAKGVKAPLPPDTIKPKPNFSSQAIQSNIEVKLQSHPIPSQPFTQSVDDTQLQSNALITSASPASTKKLLVACIDDSPVIAHQMKEILEAGGYEILAILDPLKGISTLLERKPDLIFLDLVMPNSNGYELCTFLRKTSAFHDTPIIILTGRDGVIDRVRAKMSGSSDFLGKPPVAGKVLLMVQKYLSAKIADLSSFQDTSTSINSI